MKMKKITHALLMMVVINQCFGSRISSPLSFPVLLAGIPSRQYFGTPPKPIVGSPSKIFFFNKLVTLDIVLVKNSPGTMFRLFLESSSPSKSLSRPI